MALISTRFEGLLIFYFSGNIDNVIFNIIYNLR
jgi:hypothetical protein